MTFTEWFFDGMKLKYESKYPKAQKGEGKGEEQREIFKQSVKKSIEALVENQKLDRERLKIIDKKITEAIKILTDIKDKL